MSLFLGITSIEIFKYTQNLKEFSGIWSFAQFIVIMITFYMMARTGASFLKSRLEHDGVNHILYICLGIIHLIGVLVVFIVSMVIDIGTNWWINLIAVIFLVALSNKVKIRKTKHGKRQTITTVE